MLCYGKTHITPAIKYLQIVIPAKAGGKGLGKNKCAGLRRILVRMQGASSSAY